MLKKTISLFMAVIMVFAMSISASAANIEDSELSTEINTRKATLSISGTIAAGKSLYYSSYMYLDGTEKMTIDATWTPAGNQIRVEFIPRSGGTTLGWTFDTGGSVSDFTLSLSSLTAGDYYITVKALSSNTGNTNVVFNFSFS